jgi:hypothetical protein
VHVYRLEGNRIYAFWGFLLLIAVAALTASGMCLLQASKLSTKTDKLQELLTVVDNRMALSGITKPPFDTTTSQDLASRRCSPGEIATAFDLKVESMGAALLDNIGSNLTQFKDDLPQQDAAEGNFVAASVQNLTSLVTAKRKSLGGKIDGLVFTLETASNELDSKYRL